MRNYRYLIGFRRGSRVKFLETRETNFRRACKTARNLLEGNTRYKTVEVHKVYLDPTGEEFDLKLLYSKTRK